MPDIGDFKDVPVIEIFVKVGDSVKAEDPLVSLESDKATMDVPAPLSGVVQEIRVKVGDKVSEGSVIMALATRGGARPPRRHRHRRAQTAAAPPRRSRRRGAPAASTKQPSRWPMPARPCASWRASSAWTWAGSRAPASTAASCAADVEAFAKGGAAARGACGEGRTCRGRCRRRRHRPAALAEGRLREVRPGRAQGAGRASRRSRRPTCIATGSSSRTSRRTTRPTSPTSSSSACR